MPNDLDIKIKQLSSELAASFVKNYKCSVAEAGDFFYNAIAGHEPLRQVIANAASDKQLARNAVFREFVKKQRKDLYYRLRQYKSSDDSRETLMQALSGADGSEEKRAHLLRLVADFHVSSQERAAHNDSFYAALARIIGQARTIVDVGCGVQPLFFPRQQFPVLEKYTALDKDAESIALLQRFSHTFKEQYAWLDPHVWNIGDGWARACGLAGASAFDAALLLKLMPVVKRTSPELVSELARVPAAIMVISGVKESMVKKQDVERRERRAIGSFLSVCGRTAVDEFELDNEFFIIAQ